MTTFLGIGCSHYNEFFDFGYRSLEEHGPQAIGIEARILFPVKDARRDERIRQFLDGQSKIRFERVCGNVRKRDSETQVDYHFPNINQVRMYIDDMLPLGFDGSNLGYNPALAYALDNKLPIFLSDLPRDLSEVIVIIRSDGYELIPHSEVLKLAKDIDIKTEWWKSLENRESKNRYAADIVNYLFRKGFESLGIVFGMHHFNVEYDKNRGWHHYPTEYRQHIQDLVQADKKVIVDSMTCLTYEMD